MLPLRASQAEAGIRRVHDGGLVHHMFGKRDGQCYHAKSIKNAFAQNRIVYLVADWTTRNAAITQTARRQRARGCAAILYCAPGADKPVILPQRPISTHYRMMRISEAPMIEVHIIKSSEAPGGIGEPGCTAGPPSLVNAIAAATGVRIRQLPIDRNLLALRRTA